MAVSFRPACAPKRTPARRKPSPWRRRLVVERLEDRTLPSGKPILVKDINPTHFNALDIPQWTAYQGETFFSATDSIHGFQIWKTDGTAKGTVMVTDINEGPGGSLYGSLATGCYPYNLTVSQGLLFFTADDGIHGRTLWRTDGSPAGTFMVKDIQPDRGFFDSITYHGLVPFNGSLYFFAGSGGVNYLWKSDGTDAGTVMVTTKITEQSRYQADFMNVNGTLFFTGNDNALWKSDGTDAGTVQVLASTNTRPPVDLTNVNGTLYFTMLFQQSAQLWKSDGTTAGTVLVDDINPNSPSEYNLKYITNVNGRVFFVVNDGVHGLDLWTSDGTTAGTHLVKDINAGHGYPGNLTAFNGQLFFDANDGVHGVELWKSDGTDAGTALVKDINPGSYGSYPSFLTPAFGKLFFAANDGVHGTELWVTDGTAQGTVLFKVLDNPNSPYPGADISFPAFVNGTLYFAGDAPPLSHEPWKSDGTVQGTVQVAQINNRTYSSLNNTVNFVAIGNTLYFAASNGFGLQLWKSDGTADGTVIVANKALLGHGKEIKYLTNVGGTLYFVTTDEFGSSRDWSLWKSDGTTSGTVLVDDFGQIPFSRYSPPALFDLVGAGHTLFFLSTMGGFGEELWSSNGTAAGTHVININPAPYAGSYPFGLRNIKGTLYFAANDGTHGYELWKSDGTVAGTVLVKDINTLTTYGFPHGSYPYGFTEFKGSIYFSANDGVHGDELWKTDGTTAGTVLAADIVPGATGSYPSFLTKSGGRLFFSATDGVNPVELWKTDGKAAGTTKVVDIEPGSGDAGIGSMIAFQGGVLFQVFDSKNGTEIWDSNGTAAGTVLLAHFSFPGTFVPLQLTSVGNFAYFVVDDGVHGQEVWQTDGTPAGTFLTADLFPGPTGSNPRNLTNVDGTLFFAANDSIHGIELFKIPPSGDNAGSQAAALVRTPSARLADNLGSTGLNIHLPPAPAPIPPVAGPPPTTSRPAGLPTSAGVRTTTVFAALSGGSAHARPLPQSDAIDALDSGAIDALFATIG